MRCDRSGSPEGRTSPPQQGVSTAYTIVGARLAPKLLDLYLGRSGVVETVEEEPTHVGMLLLPCLAQEVAPLGVRTAT